MAARILGLVLVGSLLLASAAAAQVVYVGDSLGVGTTPPLRERLSASLDADVESGRASTEGVGVLSAMLAPEHEVVVFDLGTNDDPAAPDVLATDLAAARSLAGERCMVVATVNRPPLNGVDVDGLNAAIRGFAASDPATEVVEWRATAARDPELLFDGVHAGPEGYALRAELFADAIERCLTFAGPGQPAPRSRSTPPPKADAGRPSSPPRPRPPDPLRELAGELARAVAVGAEFG